MKLDLHCQACFAKGVAGEHLIRRLALHAMAKLSTFLPIMFRLPSKGFGTFCNTATRYVSAALRCRGLSIPSSELPLRRLDAHVHHDNSTFCFLCALRRRATVYQPQEKPRSVARTLFSVWVFTAVWFAGHWVLPLALPSLASSATAFVRVLCSFICGLPAATVELLDWLFYALIVVAVAAVELLDWLLFVLVVVVVVAAELLDWLLYMLIVGVFVDLITGLCACVCDLVWLLKVFVSCFWAELTIISFTSRLLWFYMRRK